MIQTIGFGGSCHWCTEAVFQSLEGVQQVKQGWLASDPPHQTLSEGVVVEFDPDQISIKVLVSIHLYTHQSTSEHAFREKYRSAIYYSNKNQEVEIRKCVHNLQVEFEEAIITQILANRQFKLNKESLQDYYYTNPDKPFCQTHIDPKLRLILSKFGQHIDRSKLGHLIDGT